MQHRILVGAAAGLTALALAGAANGQTKTLRISSWAPPTHHINSKVWPAWGECIKKATEGRVTYKIEYKLASPPRQFDLVRKGVADAAWLFHGYNAGRYVATQIVEIPLLGTSAEAASVAYWRIHQKYLEKAREHKGVMVVGLTSHGPAVIHTRKPIKKMTDLKGMKIRIPSPIAAAIATHFGAIGVKLPAPKVYEALSSGVADGIFMPVETQKSFRLAEVAPNVI
ncbi:MAG: TRAP transporter substrate-binding protein, partial [Methyloligellaceae bacterium]